jgi:hypothetical protein
LSHVSAGDLEIEKKYPISPYRLLGAVGIVIFGFGVALLYLNRPRKE